MAADPGAGAGLLPRLLRRRLLFVTGKGGTGKSTVSAALALTAARGGKRVLCVDVDAKGDLAAGLGSGAVGFAPRVVQPNISVLALRPEESLREYLNVYLHVPRLARLTPLSRIVDFLATGVPGARDMLVIGKIAYEERRRERDGSPVWDLIVVDLSASGHAVPQIGAARAMLDLVRGGGLIRSQVEWIDDLLRDRRRTLLTVCALPEEMPVVEAIELCAEVGARRYVALGACFLNRAFPDPVGSDEVLFARAATRAHAAPAEFAEGVELARRLRGQSAAYGSRLRKSVPVPVVEVPFTPARQGLAMSRAVAAALDATGAGTA
jgi:anion-transporting  ArsA/GET3 family ATPase